METFFGSVVILLLAYAIGLVVHLLARRKFANDPGTLGVAGFDWLKERKADVVFLLLLLTYFVVFAGLSLLKHESWHSGLDLAIFDQKIWNSLFGDVLKSTIVDSQYMYGAHFSPLLVALAPFYALLDDARTLLILQTALLALAAIPMYWYAREQLGCVFALVISLSFFLSSSLQSINFANFHEISLAVPLLAFAIFFILRNRYKPFLVCLTLALLVKEEIAALVVAFGVYTFLVHRRRWYGACLAVFGGVSLALLVLYVVPYLDAKGYVIARQAFASFGSSMPEIVWGIATNPLKVVNLVLYPTNLEFVLNLLVPLALIPLVGFEVSLIALPVILGLFLSTGRATIFEHYTASQLLFLYFGTIVGARRLSLLWVGKERAGLPSANEIAARKLALTVVLFVTAVASYANLAPGPWGGTYAPEMFVGNVDTAVWHQIVSRVPRDAVVVAQEELSPHFSNRKEAYVFPSIPDYRQADWLVAQKGRFFYNFHKGAWDDWMSTGYFEIVVDKDDFILARRKAPEQQLNIRFGDCIALLGYTLVPAGRLMGGTTLRPIVEWRAEKTISEKYRITLQVVDPQGHVWSRTEGEPQDGMLPTTQWLVGKSVGDQYLLSLPPTMPTGDYQIALEVHRADGEYVEAFDAQGGSLGTGVVMATVHIEKTQAPVTASQLPIGQRLFMDMREMRLLGFELPHDQASPGDQVQVGLYWRARSKPQGDYVVVIQLLDANDRIVFEQKTRPADGTYPTIQ